MADINEKIRAEFVHAFIERFGFGPMTASSNPDAAQMFEAAEWAWRASREALVIELPPVQMAQRSDEEATFSAGGNDMRRKVIKAIEACGVKATA